MTYQELLKIDFGEQMGERFRGEKIPTLEEFLRHFGGKELHFAIEIKERGVEEETLRLIRQYCRNLNSEIMKKRVINAAVTLGIYTRGINQDSIVQDCVEALCQLNDNDIHDAFRFKQKKARQFNASELAETYVDSDTHEYQIVNINTGELLTDIIP